MSNNLTAFTEYVNEELPKRVYTEDDSTEVQPSLIPVSTGIGLGVTFKSLQDIGLGGSGDTNILSFKNHPVEDFKINLPHHIELARIIQPLVVTLESGAIVEVVGISVTDKIIHLDEADYVEIGEMPTSVSFDYYVSAE